MMKKMMMTLMAMLLVAASGKAMSYEQARNEALFLTDKMAYELNLTDEQYEAAYEINLDYLMGVTSYDDVYATYWERRNLDMSYVLLDWQWEAFCAASYFYRPLYWDGGYWHFGIYARYPHRDYFYFGRPVFYASYRGGHAWHHVGGRGYYYGRRDHFRPVAGRSHFGMLDRWNRGDFRANHHPSAGQHRGYIGGQRSSSTRTTVHHGRDLGQQRSSSYENSRRFGSRPSSSAVERPGSGTGTGSSTGARYRSSGSFSGSHSGSSHSSFGGGSHSSSHSSASSHSSGSFSGNQRSASSHSSSHSSHSSSHSSASSHSSSHSSGSHSSSSGGRSFGGRR